MDREKCSPEIEGWILHLCRNNKLGTETKAVHFIDFLKEVEDSQENEDLVHLVSLLGANSSLILLAGEKVLFGSDGKE